MEITPKKIVWSQASRLNCKFPGVVQRYNKWLEKKIQKHRLIERIRHIYQAGLPGEEANCCLDKIDVKGNNYMNNAKKKYQKIKAGWIPFPPEVAKWIQRVQVYKFLLKFTQSGQGNWGNLCCMDDRIGILDHFQLWEENIQAWIKVGQELCNYPATQ